MLNDLLHGGNRARFGSKKDCSKRIHAYEAAWARLQSDTPGWPQDSIDQEFQKALIGWLQFHHATLIGELVPETLRFLRGNPASDACSSFDHLIVDEYQDLNKAEQALIELIAGNGSIAIVGDEDQSIYRFRYANPEGIRDFHHRYPSTHDETLDECRRCPQRVVVMANCLIRNNHLNVHFDRLHPKLDNPQGSVHIVQWQDTEQEASGIADFVQFLVNDRGYKPGDILIVTPRRLLGYSVRDHIKQANVPVHSFFNEEPLEEEAAQRAFALLTLIANPDDRVALRWWLGSGSPTGLPGQYHKLRQYCEKSGVAPRAALDDMVNGTLKVPGITKLLPKYRELQMASRKCEGLSLADLVDEVLPDGVDDLSVLRGVALRALIDVDNAKDLHDRIRTFVIHQEMPEESSFVRVMSLHKSKGLTSKVTIVTGCVQGLLPTLNDDASISEQAENLQEQRRLFYVAITRPTEVLVLSSAIRMDRQIAHRVGAKFSGAGQKLVNVMASQFVNELGASAPGAIVGSKWVDEYYRMK